jgi:hypothetical protein
MPNLIAFHSAHEWCGAMIVHDWGIVGNVIGAGGIPGGEYDVVELASSSSIRHLN